MLVKNCGFALILLSAGCARGGSTAELGPVVTMQVAGAASRGASLAASGSRVVMVWAATEDAQTNIYSAVSSDGGRTFAQPIRVNDIEGDARVNDEQPPRVAISQEIVVVWQSRKSGAPAIRIARSRDGGRSFDAAQTAHDPSLTGTRGWSSVAIDGTGAIHLAWLDTRSSVQKTASKPKTPHVHGSGTMKENVFHTVLRSDGTRSESLVAADVCFCCKTGVTVGPDDTTYVAWRHIYPTDLRDMAVARSAEDGFMPPTRVSEDGWQLASCPEDGPAIVVDASNVLHIAWPTMVDAAKSRKGVFYSYSTDGGRTFAPRVRVDDAEAGSAAHPQISLSPNGVAVVWDETVTGSRRIRLRSITSAAQGTRWQPQLSPTVDVIDGSPVSLPAVAHTDDGLVVSWTQRAANSSDVRTRRLAISK